MITQADIETGAAALRAYVYAIDGWEANFVQWGTYEQGAALILKAWDAEDASMQPAARYAACGAALYKTIYDAGYASQVTQDQCTAGAKAVLAVTRNPPTT